MKITKTLAALLIGFSVFTTGCGELDTLLNETDVVETGEGSAATDSDDDAVAPVNKKFQDFLKPGDTYFGPVGENAHIDSGLTGNDAAGSRYGGPNDAVGVLIVVRNARGYMEVVNLNNGRRFPVVHSTDGSPFSVETATLGGKPFPSLFVLEIPSLTEFSFDHRFPGATPKCNRYNVTYKGTATAGTNTATKQGETGACRVKF